MATELNKAIHRAVEIEGADYIVSLQPDPPRVTLRKKRHTNLAGSISISDILEPEAEEEEKDYEWVESSLSEKEWEALDKYKPSDVDYIHPSDLEMWARNSYPKFKIAWDQYRSATRGNKQADIIWNTDGSIEIANRPE
jgi:hypothetical protein